MDARHTEAHLSRAAPTEFHGGNHVLDTSGVPFTMACRTSEMFHGLFWGLTATGASW